MALGSKRSRLLHEVTHSTERADILVIVRHVRNPLALSRSESSFDTQRCLVQTQVRRVGAAVISRSQ